MKCHIVKDLLPEYIENLCSPETTQEIENHLNTCHSCSQVLQHMTEPMDDNSQTEAIGTQDIKPFRKIQRIMRKDKIKKVVAIVALVAVCLVFGTLTVGQIFPSLSCPSYDSLLYRYRGWKIAKELVEGDMEKVLGGCTGRLVSEQYRDQDVFFHQTVNQLTSLRNNVFEGKDVKISVTGVTYDSELFSSEPEEYEDLSKYYVDMILTVDDKKIDLLVSFDNPKYYYIDIRTEEHSFLGAGSRVLPADIENIPEYNIKMMNAYLDYYYYACQRDSVEQLILNGRISSLKATELPETKDDLTFATFYIIDNCLDMTITDGDKYKCYTKYQVQVAYDLYEIASRCNSNTFQLAFNRYNQDKKAFDATLYWEITDLNGKQCVMTKPFYFGPMGYEVAGNSEKIYADDGFDETILEYLEKIFDKS